MTKITTSPRSDQSQTSPLVLRLPLPVPPDLADLIGSLQQQIGALNGGQAAGNDPAPSEQAASPETDEFGNTPLSQGQAMHVDHLLSVETDSLAREVLITLKREGLPPNDQWREFLEQYALSGWYASSDAIAWNTLSTIANSDWDETLALADTEYVEDAAQDLGNDLIEGLVIIDAKTGEPLLNRTGVVTAEGSQFVGMQDTEAAELKDRELIFVHNHPNGSDASDEDLMRSICGGRGAADRHHAAGAGVRLHPRQRRHGEGSRREGQL